MKPLPGRQHVQQLQQLLLVDLLVLLLLLDGSTAFLLRGRVVSGVPLGGPQPGASATIWGGLPGVPVCSWRHGRGRLRAAEAAAADTVDGTYAAADEGSGIVWSMEEEGCDSDVAAGAAAAASDCPGSATGEAASAAAGAAGGVAAGAAPGKGYGGAFAARMRLTVTLSNNHIYSCITDPSRQRTFAFASSQDKELKETLKTVQRKKGLVPRQHGGTLHAAAAVGALVAERGLRAGIRKVYFDRKKYRFAGRVAALADGARKAGLDF
ncbi:hypothetical protein, conserved [Eimeria maxima]|uniref:50S ribosomal protein L18 n=1 Tax=Eimeria maxima TaxID=5804 RepID=U6M7F1_EIMMA|nr:hypothetical protein, conserved [Eimeria maxima]CDJ60132.1 hypothetical protein, conserved [Eimeria maxima]